MAEFRFTVAEEGLPPEGYELGDMEVIGSSGTASSRGHNPSESMLIYISLSDMLDGLTPLIKRGRGSFKFEGTRSSFSLRFTLKKNHPMVIESGKTVIDESPAMAVASALWSATQEFTHQHLATLPEHGQVRYVLEESISKFQDALNRQAR